MTLKLLSNPTVALTSTRTRYGDTLSKGLLTLLFFESPVATEVPRDFK